MWQVRVLTLFPELFPGILAYSVTGNALKEGIWSIESKDIRDFAHDKHKTVDEPPYGGGGGMVMKADVLGDAIEEFFLPNGYPIIYLSPRGKVFNQGMVREFTKEKGINILCGRFEGVDERVLLQYKIAEVSVGDYVLSSGDIASFTVLDACIRTLPEVLDSQEALEEESFGLALGEGNMLEYPHYTRPQVWKGLDVPEVLLSGNHQAIKRWRLERAVEKTKIVRPDLLSE